MSELNCSCNPRCKCIIFSIAASIIIGIVTAFLTITATITVAPLFLWATLGIAVVYLGVTLLAAPFSRQRATNCICSTVSALLTGILGTILTSVILLAVAFAATSIIGAIITGLLLLFLTLIFTATACLVKELINCD